MRSPTFTRSIRFARWLPLAALFIGLPVSAAPPEETETPEQAVPSEQMTAPTNAKETYADIEKTFGIVPTFMKLYPDEGITGAWQEMKQVELAENTAVPPKYKELIGLAVAAQVPCDYCVYFHTQAAKLAGATDQEVREAVAMAGQVRHWSTILNGGKQEMQAFRQEIDKAFENLERQAKAGQGEGQTPTTLTDAASVQQDLKQTFGQAPTFFDTVADAGQVGAWKMMRDFQMSGKTAIPAKYKSLIGVAVAAQVPCDYCTYFETKAARHAGATDAEINEAVTVAAITRHWSTFLNGIDQEQSEFRKEVDQVMDHLKKVGAT